MIKKRVVYVVQACNKPSKEEPKWQEFMDIHGDIYHNPDEAQESFRVLKLYESAIVKYRLIKRTEEIVA